MNHLFISEYDYPLPGERIARHPLADRASCRLLVSESDGSILHRRFTDLPDLLPPGALLVRNNTRVINARLLFAKPTGAHIEVFLLEPDTPAEYVKMFEARGRCRWKALVGNRKRWKSGALTLELPSGVVLTATIPEGAPVADDGQTVADMSWTPEDVDFATVVEEAGKIPIPPYLNRDTEQSDSVDYQTVYSRIEGSVAAPTAGLHFTPGLFAELQERCGVTVADVTLHVGAGTFKPVKVEDATAHTMHTEHFVVERSLVETVLAAKRSGRQIVAVGTTSVRTLETLPLLCCGNTSEGSLHLDQWTAYSPRARAIDTIEGLERLLTRFGSQQRIQATTAIMIAPGFRWRIADQIITNFHQPKSTLLLLVASFMEREESIRRSWRELYDAALANDYRFLSYGDACLIK